MKDLIKKIKAVNFSELKDEFKSLNPKEMYAWPLGFQFIVGAGILVLSLVGGYFYDSIPTEEELQASIDKEDTLKKQFIEKKKQAVNLDLYQQQLEEVTRDSDILLKQLPNKSEIEKLLVDINQAGINRGLEFELFKPEKEVLHDFYAVLPINIKVVGSYDAIGNFAADVAKLPRVVLFDSMDITSKDKKISLSATLKTFRYLDTEEINKQKQEKLAKEKADKKGAKKWLNTLIFYFFLY